MADETRLMGNSIEELLVAIAEGVREAQAALDQGPSVDGNGLPLATYHLPYLDFTIKVEMTTKTDSGGRPIAMLMAAPKGSTSSAAQSSVSGRLIAVPPGEGLPLPRLSVATGGNIGGFASIAVTVTNSAGETLANQPIELNIDTEASTTLSLARGAPAFARGSGTRLDAAVLTTGADGVATTRLRIDSKQNARQVVVITATLGTASARGVILMEEVG
ncbi:hypothetical protein [Allosphingosinicella deserti]|uniref:Uncharacterized protein n=1 Tax=Allosphingosinicella deserti TaxID=2116704 RepID=A0A2P7QLI8_9SPHN|nr:hypothetical protein [Sphingomonas deserti]PSJ38822.1 hypothetical protein C7I55_15965 [Sphingomonas deserti]